MRSCKGELLSSAAAPTSPERPGAAGGERLAYSITDAASASGIGRTKLYEFIRDGRLEARKMGRRTLIPAASLHALLASLPTARPTFRTSG